MNSALGITQNKKGRQQRMKLTIFGDRRYRSAPPRAGRRRRPRPHSSRTEPEEALRTGAPRHRRPGGPGGDRVGGRRSRRGALPPRSAVGARDGDRDPGNPGAIVQAMQATDVRRLVVVSAAPVSTVPSPGRPQPPRHDPGEGYFMRHHLHTPLHHRGLAPVPAYRIECRCERA
jgi:hypothetical protein